MQGTAACWALGLVIAQATFSPCLASEVLGKDPTYSERGLSEPPNAAAMTARIWVPGLDEGYVPQGLTVIEGAVYVSTYRSTDPKQGRGPCRLYRIEPSTGAVTGELDLPPACGHAGGLAKGPAGHLFVSDTWEVFDIELSGPGDAVIGRVVRSSKLTGGVKGSFAAGGSDALWLGTYAKEPGARLYKFPFSALAPQLSEADATASVAMPLEAQGAAFDAAGRLWVSRSGSRSGELMQLDVASGEVRARYAMPAGIEDLSFDSAGQIWTLSEAGSRRWLGWDTFFPVIFRLDPALLR